VLTAQLPSLRRLRQCGGARRTPRGVSADGLSRTAGPQRVVVIKLGALGDIVHAFRGFAAIRLHHAADHITLLTTAAYRDLGEAAPWFDAVQLDPRAPWWDLPANLRTVAALRRFDRVYDLQNSHRTRRYFWFAGCPRWSSYSSDRSQMHVHTIERHRKQLEAAGIRVFPSVSHEWLVAGARLRELPTPYAALVPGGAGIGVGKRWPVEHWQRLARHLLDRGVTPVIIGGTSERDIGRAIRSACASAIDLAGETSISDVAVIGKGAVIAVGNDTGPLHLAAATGAPAVVLLSAASSAAVSAPLGPHGEWPFVIQEPLLASVPADRVIAAVDKILASCSRNDRRTLAVTPALSDRGDRSRRGAPLSGSGPWLSAVDATKPMTLEADCHRAGGD
jgi:ADP-heptose:LPS heptosyltransferase